MYKKERVRPAIVPQVPGAQGKYPTPKTVERK